MRLRKRSLWAIVLIVAGLAAPARSRDDAPASSARSEAMRELAKAVVLTPAGSEKKAELIPDPLLHWDDPARAYSDGTIWAFGKVGRPAALFCLSLEKDSEGELRWIHELTSLAAGPVVATSRHESGAWRWSPKMPGLQFQAVPKAPAPAADEPKRLRQVKEIARRFKASESIDPERDDPADRFELRLLPQPVHRYADPASGLIDGAIFLMSYGRNPELVLLIEARREGTAAPSWTFGLTRIAAARLRVSIDDKEVADLPRPTSSDSKSTYFNFARPAVGLQ